MQHITSQALTQHIYNDINNEWIMASVTSYLYPNIVLQLFNSICSTNKPILCVKLQCSHAKLSGFACASISYVWHGTISNLHET